MRKILFIICFALMFAPIAIAGYEKPVPEGQGTYAELGEENTFTGDNAFDSIQSDTITVGREQTNVLTKTAVIAIAQDDTFINGGTWDYVSREGSLGVVNGIDRNHTYRFGNLGIPQGSTIRSVQLQVTTLGYFATTTKWKIGLVNSSTAVTPVSFETFQSAQDSLPATQDTGTISGVNPTSEVFLFPTESTGTIFMETLQSLVSSSAWDSDSAVMAVLSNDDSVGNQYLTLQHHGSLAGPVDYPKLVITYTEGLAYLPVGAGSYVPRIFLPDTLYGVVGDTLQLFIRGMVEAQDPYALPVIVESTIGSAYPRYFEVTPADDTNVELTVTVLDLDYDTLVEKTVNIVVTDPAAEVASPINVGIVGNSLTSEGQWPTELYRMLTGSGGTPSGLSIADITFVGDRDMSTYTGTAAYTGNSGWSFERYIGDGVVPGELVTLVNHGRTNTCTGSTWTQDSNTWKIVYVDTDIIKLEGPVGETLPAGGGTLVNAAGTCNDTGDIVYTSSVVTTTTPFWDEGVADEFEFLTWQTRNVASGTLDAMYVLLGWNNIGSRNRTDWTAYMLQVRTFLNKLHSDIPGCIVRIIGIQGPSPTGGLGANYDSDFVAGQYYPLLRSANNLNAAYQALANEDAYSTWVEFIGIMPQFDSEYNMQMAEVDVNTRNSATELLGTNGLHPANEGYDQIADAVYREFIATFLE